MSRMAYAGVGWPANAGGEHPDRETIYRLTGVADGALLMCADSARYWYSEARNRCPLVVWRGLPRPDRLPARLGWDPERVADEVLNLWDEQPHGPSGAREYFTPLNELQFCLVPDQRVTALGPTRATMRRYKGNIVTIETATGNKVTATPNHPILTRQGWLPAGEIHEGTEVAQRALRDGPDFRGPNDVQVPTPICEVFRALQERSTTARRVVSRDDFHGDGQEGDVYVVRADRLLRDTLSETAQDLRFVQPSGRYGALAAARSALPHVERLLLPATAFPGGHHAGSPFGGRFLVSPQASSLSTAACGPAALLEREQERGGHGASEPVSGLSSGVTFVQVSHVSVSQFNGHVYGLTTEDECIYADDIVTHNSKEAGEGWRGYAYMAARLAALRVELRSRVPSSVRLLFPAWVPSDDMDHLHEWQQEAALWDGLIVHCYGSAETMRVRYASYRSSFPGSVLFIGEWNANHEGHDERDGLTMWAEVARDDPNFLGAAYFIWETRNQGEEDLSIWGDSDRLQLFQHPPTVSSPVTPPVPPEKPPEPEPVPVAPGSPWEHWTAAEIAAATECPLENVILSWPKIVAQLQLCGIADRAVQRAVLATVAIETAHQFKPVREAYWLSDAYRASLSYAPWWARGQIQLTHADNFRIFAARLADLWGPGAPDIYADPELALDPDVSAAVCALYFRDTATVQGYTLVEAARAADWEWVRRLVQGGVAGLGGMIEMANALGDGTGVVPVPDVSGDRLYGPDVPADVISQKNSWSCAVRSTYAALWAMAALGQAPAVTYGDGGLRDIYAWLVPEYDDSSVGLHDASGAGLVSVLLDHGYLAGRAVGVSLADVQARAGLQPVLLGFSAMGPAGHWVYCRGQEADGTLILENPAVNYVGISDRLRDSFGRFGTVTMVWLETEAPVVVPPVVPPDPTVTTMVVDAAAWARLVSFAGYASVDLSARVAALPAKTKKATKERDAVVAELVRAGREALR